jgi:hypothetical protein
VKQKPLRASEYAATDSQRHRVNTNRFQCQQDSVSCEDTALVAFDIGDRLVRRNVFLPLCGCDRLMSVHRSSRSGRDRYRNILLPYSGRARSFERMPKS